MTREEFDRWWAYHATAFPDVLAWMKKQTRELESTFGKPLPDENKPLQAWFRVIGSVDLSAAKDATDAILSGRIESPRGYSKHPAAIRQWTGDSRAAEMSHENSRAMVDGEQTCSCPDCLDTGWVLILNARETERTGTPITCQAVCTCEAGDNAERNNYASKRRPSARYDAATMLRLVDSYPDAKTLADGMTLAGDQFAQWNSGA